MVTSTEEVASTNHTVCITPSSQAPQTHALHKHAAAAVAVAAAAEQAFSIIEDGAYRLAAAQKVTAGVVEPTVGNAGVCTGPALLSRKDVDGFTTEFDCQGIDATATVRCPRGGGLLFDAEAKLRGYVCLWW
jgi:hypothetical protein